jgi:hypothetical protein
VVVAPRFNEPVSKLLSGTSGCLALALMVSVRVWTAGASLDIEFSILLSRASREDEDGTISSGDWVLGRSAFLTRSFH